MENGAIIRTYQNKNNTTCSPLLSWIMSKLGIPERDQTIIGNCPDIVCGFEGKGQSFNERTYPAIREHVTTNRATSAIWFCHYSQKKRRTICRTSAASTRCTQFHASMVVTKACGAVSTYVVVCLLISLFHQPYGNSQKHHTLRIRRPKLWPGSRRSSTPTAMA